MKVNVPARRVHVVTIPVLLGVAMILAGAPAEAGGGHGGGHHGGGARAPRVAAPHHPAQASHARAPRATNIAPRSHAAATRSWSGAPAARSSRGSTRSSSNAIRTGTNHAGPHGRPAPVGASGATSGSSAHHNTVASTSTVPMLATHATRGSIVPTVYTYGQRGRVRPYRAYGYGVGYRNRYYGGRYGYGRSQANNRAIVGRLRSVYMSLAQIDHDYQGHRVRAMRAIGLAIRQLSHRSMMYGGTGTGAAAMGVAFRPGLRRSALGGGGVGQRGQPMSQAQSDARMLRNLRILQGTGMQLVNLGSPTYSHARALGHIQQAILELNAALSIR